MHSDTTPTKRPTPSPGSLRDVVAGVAAPLSVFLRSLRPSASHLRQATRVMIGAATAFVIYEVLGLPQGYWAVFTVVIVMQGSAGGTLAASTDRMLGTIAGAVIGGVAAALHPATRVGLGVALVLAIGVSTLLASVRPTLKVSPVTAAIMLLSANNGLSPQMTVLYRVAEIAIGGLIGVGTAWLILPSPANQIAADRARGVLDGLAELMTRQARALRTGAAFVDDDAHLAVRRGLAMVETAMVEAERERSSRLAEHAIPPAVPRTLWRVRNDVVLVGRALASPLPPAAQVELAEVAASLLEGAATFARDAGEALCAIQKVKRDEADLPYSRYQQAFARLREGGGTREMTFEAVGRVFGLAFALEGLHANLADLADRIDEVARGHVAQADRRAHRRR